MEETNRIEFKSELNNKLEREVVAFLNNREGGVIYIGIDDTGKAIGVNDTDEIQTKVAQRIKDNIYPNTLGLFDIVVEEIEGKKVVKIILSSGTEKPYYVKQYGMSPAGCYMRVGAATMQMTTAQIDDLYSRRLHSSIRNISSPRQDLTFTQLKIYYQGAGYNLNDNFAKSLEFVDENGKYNYLAYLMADDNGTSIKIAKYAGTDKYDLIESEEFGYCSLIKSCYSVLNRLRTENHTYTKITSSKRLERSMVDSKALREAVINAFVHNDWTREIPPVFEIYSDRIEITSFGGLIYGQDIVDFFSMSSMPRCRELMRIFKDLNLVEQLGSGMTRILRAYNRDVFQISNNFIKVVLPFDKMEEGFELMDDTLESKNETLEDKNDTLERDNDTLGQKDDTLEDGDRTYRISKNKAKQLKGIEEELLKYLSIHPEYTYDQLAEEMGKSRATISRTIQKLRDKHIITRDNGKRFGKWRIIKEGE